MQSTETVLSTTTLDRIKNWAVTAGYKLVVAVVILIIGFKIVNAVSKKIGNLLSNRTKVDKTVQKTLVYVLAILLKLIIVLFLISYLGIETAGLSAILGSAGIGIGMAVNGTLSNLSGGVMLLLTRPFSIGDYISAQGQEGTVQDIHISYTRILTTDKKNVYLPNSMLSSGTIVNYSSSGFRRVSYDFSIGENDPETVKALLKRVIAENEFVLKDPAPEVRLDAFAEGKGTRMFTAVYCKSEHYWDVYYGIYEKTNKIFRENGITVPEIRALDVKVNKQ